MQETRIEGIEEMERFAKSVLGALDDGVNVLALHGDLGAGKTAFVQALSRVLGIQEHVPSPTFVLMRRYPIPAHKYFKTLIHIDAYRIERAEEAGVLKLVDEVQNPENIVCIEWAERIPEQIPADAYHLTFTHAGDDVRTVAHDFDI